MKVERLVYGRENAIESYAAFDRRCREFALKYAPPTTPIDPMLRENFARWIGQPDLAGYFVAWNGNSIIGHIAGWVVNFYGQLRIFVWQVEIDQHMIGTLDLGVKALKDWISSLNVQLPAPVQTIELSTWHDPKVFSRYLKKAGLTPTLITSTIQFQI